MAYATKLHLALLLTLALAACELRKLGDGDGDSQTSSTGETTTDGGSDTGSPPTTGAGDASTSGAPGGDTGGDPSSSGETTGEPPAACATVDHDACFTSALEACQGEGNWQVTPACVDAVLACYPITTDVLTPTDVIEFCHAEFPGDCLSNNAPGCSETFCDCTAGVYPFDWTNCWDLLLIGCHPGVTSDCPAALAGCYPDATVAQYDVCRQQVIDTVGQECDCPMCDAHVECEQALDACLGV